MLKQWNFAVTRFFYKTSFYKKVSLEKPQKLKKMLRKFPASDAWAAVFINANFS